MSEKKFYSVPELKKVGTVEEMTLGFDSSGDEDGNPGTCINCTGI